MIRSFLISFHLKDTYRKNSIIYSLKQLPIIGRLLPEHLYQNKGLNIFAHIMSILYEIVTIFLGKLLYVFLMISLAVPFYGYNQADLFLHIMFFLTIIGAFVNSFMFNPTKDKYYAMMIMNMDARKYTLANYYYALIKLVVGFMPFVIIFGINVQLPIWLCILLPFFVAMMKMIINAFHLKEFEKKKQIKNESQLNAVTYLIIAISLVIAYGLPLLGIYISQTLFLILFVMTALLAVKSWLYIQSFYAYKDIYKQLLTDDNINAMKNATSQKAVKKEVEKKIVFDPQDSSHKTGYAYFHELFFKRHRKILTDAIKKQTLVIIGLAVIMSVAVEIDFHVKMAVNTMIMTFLPYFLFIMYIINRGQRITQAMFMNCDHSMLTYRVYRTPRVILAVFKERLKTVVFLNLIPAFSIGLSLAWLLYLSGGTKATINYAVIIVSICAMSVFFSVHYLVLYYLLQPYNIQTEIKSSTYQVIQSVTYFVCYFMMGKQLPTLQFGMSMIVFCIIYMTIALFLIYYYAPKTFKIRV